MLPLAVAGVIRGDTWMENGEFSDTLENQFFQVY